MASVFRRSRQRRIFPSGADFKLKQTGTSFYSDEVYVMNGGVLSNSTVIGGKVEVYSGGTARGITQGNAETVGHIMAYGGTLKNITVKNGGVYLYSDSVVSGLTVAADSSSAELTVHSGQILDGVTVKSGSRLHVNFFSDGTPGGEFRNVTVDENAEAVFFDQKVTGLTMTGNAVVEVTNGTLSGRITVTPSVPDDGHWLTLTESTLDFDVSNVNPGTVPLVNNFSWIEKGSNVSYALTVSENQKNGTYKLAGGAAGFDQTLMVSTGKNDIGFLTVNGAGLIYGDYNFTLTASDDSLLLKVRGGKDSAAGFLVSGKVIHFGKTWKPTRIMMPEMSIRSTLPIGIWWEPVRSAAERPDCSGRNTQPARSICRKMRKMYPI